MTRFWGAISVTLLLAACGGGGSDSSSDPAPGATTDVTMRAPITGFGSVIVNGVRFDTSAAQYQIDDKSGAGQDDLAAGQMVVIAGSVDDKGNHQGAKVIYSAEVRGPVESVDGASSSFVAVGQTVLVTDETVLVGLGGVADLAAGDIVEVSGMRDGDGWLQATYLEKEDGSPEVQLRGSVTAHDAGLKRFGIGGAVVDYATATLVPTGLVIADGLFVEVEGMLEGELLKAAKVKLENGFGSAHEGRRGGAAVEGIVSSVGGDGSFVIDSVSVVVNASTIYVGGSAAAVLPGVRLEAEGRLQEDGSLLASKVKFKPDGGKGEFEGVIESIDASTQTISLLGTQVVAVASTRYKDGRDKLKTFGFASLAVGDWAEIAFVSTSTQLQATRIERDEADDRSQVKGPLQAFDAATEQLTIAGVDVDATSASYQHDEAAITQDEFYAAIAAGSRVKAKGSYAAGLLTATEVELDDSEDHDGDHGGSDDHGGDDHGGGDEKDEDDDG